MAFILSIIGCMIIFSASNPLKIHQSFFKSYAFRQALFILLGLAVAFVIFTVSQRFIAFITWIAYPANILMLIAVLFIGSVRMGARRWLSFGGFSVQPSEFCKITIILALAQYFQWDFENRKTFRFFFISVLLACVPMAFIIKQPDLGTAMIILPILFSMLFLIGANKYYLFGSVALGVAAAPFFWMRLAQYQKDRLLTFINPNADPMGSGYTLLQSKVAIGSGGLFGKGWFHGTQTQLGFLPEKHTDFIFSVLGEEWGFIGSSVVIGFYFILLYFSLAIANEARTVYGKAAAVGLCVMLFTHIFINTAMTIGLMPITGLPLPFLSYGGSSLLTSFIAVGLLLNIYGHRTWL